MKTTQLIGIVSVLVASHWALAQEPQITTQPTNTTASLGATVQFKVTAKAGSAPLAYYHWHFKDAPLDTNANPSAAKPTLALTNVTVAQAGPYWAVVVDTAGLSATSQVATLTVDPTFTKVMSGPPVDDPSGDGYCATWGDYDGDGDVDLAVVGGWNAAAYPPLLYTNQGNATLSRVTAAPWTTPRSSYTANWADYDNDGDLDLWAGSVTSYPVLYTNQGAGQFTAIAASPTWIENQVTVRGDLQAWADYDSDGYLDLAVANYGNATPPPMALLHNSANGKFTAVTNSPLAAIRDFSSSLDWLDYDGDGDLDLIASRSSYDPMLLFRNEGGFLNPQRAWDLDTVAGIASNFAWGDYDNDGDLDAYAARYISTGLLCRNEGNGQYVALGDAKVKPLGIDNPVTPAWGDYDNDGYVDLFVTRGGDDGVRRNALFHNDGNGGFEEILSGSPVSELANSTGCAWADYDNDGDLDLFVANAVGTGTSGKDFFYVNNGNANGWLEVKLVGAAPQPGTSNRDGIGANVRVKATIGGKTFWQLRAIASGSQRNELVAHFGLGDAANVKTLRIEWPSGIVQEFANLPANQILQVRESVLVPTANAELVGPAAYEVVLGSAVTLQAPTQGQGETYQWQFNGQDIAGATGPAFAIASFQPEQIGSYSVVMTGLSDPTLGAYWGRSRAVRLEMRDRPIIAGPDLWPAIVSPGGRVEITARVTDTDSFACQWQRNGIDIASAENPSATNLTLVLDAAVQGDAGDYRIVVEKGAHRVVSGAVHLTIESTFTQITADPVVTDYQASSSGTWWDYDHDGFLDLFVAQANTGPATNVLYHSNGDGTFSKVTTNAIVKVSGYCDSGTVGDFNNDGFIDLFVANKTGANSLFRNESEGRFTRLTSAQCGPPVSGNGTTFDATWVDYDGDGFLDLFTVGYLDPAYVYRNRGDGYFVRMTSNQVGPIAIDLVISFRCSWADLDNDGYPDVWVQNMGGQHFLFHNNGNGTFSQLTEGSIPSEGAANVVALWGDYDNDGWLDLFVTGGSPPWEAGLNSLHRNLGGNVSANVASTAGVVQSVYATFGAWGDYDNDGDLDLFLTRFRGTPNVLYRNNGDGTFSSVEVGSPLTAGTYGLGTVWADYNDDGFLDLFIACGLTPDTRAHNLLFKNNGNGNAWLKLNLIGIASNRSAIGAKVRVKATMGGKTFWQMRELTGNTGLSGGHGLIPHFGLGDATSVELVKIEWPSGIVQEFQNVPVRQTLEVTEHQEGATAPSLTATRSAEGVVQLTLTGQTNLRYVFEASTDLAQWTKIGVRTNLTGAVEFTDTFAAKYAQRFYRGLAP